MGYGMQIPAHRVGGPKNIWDFRVYGLSKSWVMRVSTVPNAAIFTSKPKPGRHLSFAFRCHSTQRFQRLGLQFHIRVSRFLIFWSLLTTKSLEKVTKAENLKFDVMY